MNPIEILIDLFFIGFFVNGIILLIDGININSYLMKNYPEKWKAMHYDLPFTKRIFFLSKGTITHFLIYSDEDFGDSEILKIRRRIKNHFRFLCWSTFIFFLFFIVFIIFVFLNSSGGIEIKWF